MDEKPKKNHAFFTKCLAQSSENLKSFANSCNNQSNLPIIYSKIIQNTVSHTTKINFAKLQAILQ